MNNPKFHPEAESTFSFLLESAESSPVPEISECRLAEATGLAKYALLASIIHLDEFDRLIHRIAQSRQKRFSTLIQQTQQVTT